jgi:hypothetical protein
LGAWSFGGVEFQHKANDFPQILRIELRNGVKFAFNNSISESLHILCLKRYLKCGHFIDDNSQRPNIRFGVIWLLVPDFWTRIVRGARLGIQESLFGNFRHVEVSQFGLTFLVQKYVGRLHVSVQDLEPVQFHESSH